MSKISEKIHITDDDKIVIEQTHDYTPVLKRTAQLRSMGHTGMGENKLVGMIPMKVWAEWGKKWGVNAGDNDAMREVVARELADPDNAAFRVWEGKF